MSTLHSHLSWFSISLAYLSLSIYKSFIPMQCKMNMYCLCLYKVIMCLLFCFFLSVILFLEKLNKKEQDKYQKRKVQATSYFTQTNLKNIPSSYHQNNRTAKSLFFLPSHNTTYPRTLTQEKSRD